MEGNSQVIFAVVVFLCTYFLIILDKIHRAVVALLGASVILLFHVIEQERAVEAVDFNTLGLLIGMMVIIGITRRTGLFEYLAILSAKLSKGEPIRIMISLATVTAVVSAFLDNVTTVLLIVPVTFAIAGKLKLNPIPFLLAEVIASNIGGTATLIGDPPNIMIGSATGLGFMDFVKALTPVVIVVHIANMIWLKFLYRKQMKTTPELQKSILGMDEKAEIKDLALLKKCVFVICLTILGFITHQALHLEGATIALAGATILLLITLDDPEPALASVEWTAIFFFVGLFIVVGALEEVGVIEYVARQSLALTGGEMVPTGLLILWLSAIASAFVDNIPFVATMIPLIRDMGQIGGITDLNPLWWCLSLGACLGGNGTLIGASANVVVASLAEKRGVIITFIHFTKVAFPMMLMSVAICTVYLLIRFLIPAS
ncbi:ArsB/NhaD family transporter [Pelotomaculum terephthalicicum JT]|uniref:SLC13 family permease n=1 Tax=Pelotomaculum terephthalicicum TaxID=206393 RepID=UPI0009CCD534|nr:ArsB/NhaD family transporter [Pelotomaculum terephthalicicum]MCG9969301.1 ArsB/NhaD family transporter [Pelotomaculum terephthalicicum JT]OPY62414.1 MAG: Inner membrane protein YbiR [Pelotomaculum sp. PtaU1.Bin065]